MLYLADNTNQSCHNIVDNEPNQQARKWETTGMELTERESHLYNPPQEKKWECEGCDAFNEPHTHTNVGEVSGCDLLDFSHECDRPRDPRYELKDHYVDRYVKPYIYVPAGEPIIVDMSEPYEAVDYPVALFDYVTTVDDSTWRRVWAVDETTGRAWVALASDMEHLCVQPLPDGDVSFSIRYKYPNRSEQELIDAGVLQEIYLEDIELLLTSRYQDRLPLENYQTLHSGYLDPSAYVVRLGATEPILDDDGLEDDDYRDPPAYNREVVVIQRRFPEDTSVVMPKTMAEVITAEQEMYERLSKIPYLTYEMLDDARTPIHSALSVADMSFKMIYQQTSQWLQPGYVLEQIMYKAFMAKTPYEWRCYCPKVVKWLQERINPSLGDFNVSQLLADHLLSQVTQDERIIPYFNWAWQWISSDAMSCQYPWDYHIADPQVLLRRWPAITRTVWFAADRQGDCSWFFATPRDARKALVLLRDVIAHLAMTDRAEARMCGGTISHADLHAGLLELLSNVETWEENRLTQFLTGAKANPDVRGLMRVYEEDLGHSNPYRLVPITQTQIADLPAQGLDHEHFATFMTVAA